MFTELNQLIDNTVNLKTNKKCCDKKKSFDEIVLWTHFYTESVRSNKIFVKTPMQNNVVNVQGIHTTKHLWHLMEAELLVEQ